MYRISFGFIESVYENALAIELRKPGFIIQKQMPIGLVLNFGSKKGEVKKVGVLPGEESSCQSGLSCYPVKKD